MCDIMARMEEKNSQECIPCIWLSLVLYVSPDEYTFWIFLLMASGNVPHSSYACFDSSSTSLVHVPVVMQRLVPKFQKVQLMGLRFGQLITSMMSSGIF